MYCTNCGKEVSENAAVCLACGVPPQVARKHCHACGSEINPEQVVCIRCGVAIKGGRMASSSADSNKKLAAGLLGIFLGVFGVHKFYLGYNKEGLIMVLATVLTCFLASPITGIIGLVEGIIYLTQTDSEFVENYIKNQRPWF